MNSLSKKHFLYPALALDNYTFETLNARNVRNLYIYIYIYIQMCYLSFVSLSFSLLSNIYLPHNNNNNNYNNNNIYKGRIPKKSDIYSFNILCGNGDSQIDFEKF